jgi:hypothetical protein
MRFWGKGRLGKAEFSGGADLLPPAVCWLIAFGLACGAVIFTAKMFMSPNSTLTVNTPTASVENTPGPSNEMNTEEASKRFEEGIAALKKAMKTELLSSPIPQGDAALETPVTPTMEPKISNDLVQIPRRRPWGYFYVALYEQGDGEQYLMPVPCDPTRNKLPRACFVTEELRRTKEYIVYRSHY